MLPAYIMLPSGNVLQPSADVIESAYEAYLQSNASDLTFSSIISGELIVFWMELMLIVCHASATGNNSWPVVAVGSLIYRSNSMTDCNKAQALANFTYWTQTDPVALDIANR